MHDARYAVRTLLRQPLFAVVAVLTLALGIGANTAIFSVMYHAILRPLPIPDADRLVYIWNSYPLAGLPRATVSIPDYLDRQGQAPAIEDATLFTPVNLNLSTEGRPERVLALRITPSFFSTFQRVPVVGQPFSDQHAVPGQDKAVILSHGLWRTRLGDDPSIVGQNIRLNGEPYEVVGVMPPDFEPPFSQRIDLYVPFAFTPAQMSDQERGEEFSLMVARLRHGATVEGLNAQMEAIIRRNVERLPAARASIEASGFTAYAVDYRQQRVGDVLPVLYLLQVGVGLVLLIACANVANLLLMRATGRQREMAIRASLGAGQARLTRQLVAEGLVLASTGGLLGLGLGFLALRGLTVLGADRIPGATEASLHLPVLAFTLGLSVLTGLVFGLVPARAARRTDLTMCLADEGARTSSSRGTGHVRAVLVSGQTALALVLLIAAGLLVRSVLHLQGVDPGFSTGQVFTAQVSLPAAQYSDDGARREFWGRLLSQLERLPGAEAAGLVSNVPLSGFVSSGSYRIVGHMLNPGEPEPHGRIISVAGDYFGTLEIPLRSGRLFDSRDVFDSPRVVIIDQYLADRYFADRDPIGQQIRRGEPDSPPWTIVGVVRTVNTTDLSETVAKEALYFPASQLTLPTMSIMLRTTHDPLSLTGSVRAAVQSVDPEQPIHEVRTMDEWVARSLQTRRTPMVLLALFGALALFLSGIGLYGVLAYAVAQRTREIGIRQALGGTSGDIARLVFGQGLRTAGLGVLIGLVVAGLGARFVAGLLYGVSPYDSLVYGTATGVLMLVALLACLLPVRRAARIDPVIALRDA